MTQETEKRAGGWRTPETEFQRQTRLPIPYFGGKGIIAAKIWSYLGDPELFVEPFCGMSAVLFNRPHIPRREIVNDIDCFLINFLRTMRMRPDELAERFSYPPCEADFWSRRKWLATQADRLELFIGDPNWCDPEVAGWWGWTMCIAIGGSWSRKINARETINTHTHNGALCVSDKHRYFRALSERLACVFIKHGDWKRCLKHATKTNNDDTAILFDPPYSKEAGRKTLNVYRKDDLEVAHKAAEWAIEHGSQYRIVFCGFRGEHQFPDDWNCVRWKSRGGWNNHGDGSIRYKEAFWASPACRSKQLEIMF